jgi:hypothetical protein
MGRGMQPGQTSSTGRGGTSRGGATPNNQAAPDGPLQETQAAADGDSRTTGAGPDAGTGAMKFENEPWFSKLPPNLRQAIQSKARRDPPRGYEERLRRYFQSNN